MSAGKKLFAWIAGGVAAALLVAIGALYYLTLSAKIDCERLNLPQRWVAASIAEKWAAEMETIPKGEQNTIDLSTLEGELNWYEKALARKVLGIAPAELGFKGPYHGEEEGQDLVRMDEDGAQLLARDALEDFQEMMDQMEADIGKVLTVKSGYRSPGKQAYLFFYHLADEETGSGFSLSETARRVALPGYSEHGSPKTPAFDFELEGEDELFLEKDGAAMSDEERAALIEGTEEYKWMRNNAQRFNYYLSYPRGNDLGVDFEPWHWHWERPGRTKGP
jgi:hypothetical protein